jgi:hypothetical protein
MYVSRRVLAYQNTSEHGRKSEPKTMPILMPLDVKMSLAVRELYNNSVTFL